MFEEVIIAGAGGQGTLVMGEILAIGNHANGNYSTWQPTYGTAKRGGEANCSVVLSDEEIICPSIENPGILICFNQESYDRLSKNVAEGGIILVNSDEVTCCKERENVKLVRVPAVTLANRAGNSRTVNIIMLGALLKLRPLIDAEQVKTALTEIWGEKRAEKLLPVNLKALEIGQNAV